MFGYNILIQLILCKYKVDKTSFFNYCYNTIRITFFFCIKRSYIHNLYHDDKFNKYVRLLNMTNDDIFFYRIESLLAVPPNKTQKMKT